MSVLELELSKLSLKEKLHVLEVLWESIGRDENKMDSPAWHSEVLHDRKEKIASGKLKFSDWSSAKKRINRNKR